MKHKCPAELNSRVIRINVSSYFLLKELSNKRHLTMAEAFDLVVTELAHLDPVAVTPKTQLSMMPVAQVAGTPASAFRVGVHKPMSVTPKTAIRVTGTPAKIEVKSPNVKLRVNVAGRENGNV